MDKYKVGDSVYAKLGTLPMAGIIVYYDAKREKYLVRFNGGQQDYYSASELHLCNEDK